MSNLKSLTLHLHGETPLLCHNGLLADPLSEGAKKLKAVTGKRKKTDADHEEMGRIEWTYGLYLHPDTGVPCIPGELIEAAIINGCKKQKKGKEAKATVICEGFYPIQNGGADLSNLDELWKSGDYKLRSMVRVGTGKVARTRPMFREWSIEDVKISYDAERLNEVDVIQALSDEGAIGDWRPKYGQFTVKKCEEKKVVKKA